MEIRTTLVGAHPAAAFPDTDAQMVLAVATQGRLIARGGPRLAVTEAGQGCATHRAGGAPQDSEAGAEGTGRTEAEPTIQVTIEGVEERQRCIWRLLLVHVQ